MTRKDADKIPKGQDTLVVDEPRWREMCIARFGLSELPAWDENITRPEQPWKHLYLQFNLQVHYIIR